MRKRFGRNDIILISVIVIISVALLLIWKLVYLKGQDTDSDACVEVTIDGRAYGTYPLSKDDTIEIKNGDGDVTNTLVIKGGVADMTSADCPDHLCVKQKAISKEGESLIPFAVGIPGVKLGLTNIVTVIMLYIASPMETFLLCAFRAVLSGFMFGNAFSIIYSLAGCILSFIVMYLLKKSDKFSSVSISLVGGVCHNIGQIIVAAIVLSTYSVVYYIPVLLVAGCITGLVIGTVASQVLLRISDSFHV